MITPLSDRIPKISEKAFIHPSAEIIGNVLIGDNVWIGPHVSIRGDVGSIEILEGSNIQDGVIIHSFPGMTARIKRNAHIGHGAILHGCTVEENALIGIRSTILDGATVPSNTIIGAHSLVLANSTLAPNSLYFGSPAKWKRNLELKEVEWIKNGVEVYQNLVHVYKGGILNEYDMESSHFFKP
jgi:phenylacetic acid degradation protein